MSFSALPLRTRILALVGFLVVQSTAWAPLTQSPLLRPLSVSSPLSNSRHILRARGGTPVTDEDVDQKVPFFEFPGLGKKEEMEDQVVLLDQQNQDGSLKPSAALLGALAAGTLLVLVALQMSASDMSDLSIIPVIREAAQNPSAALDKVVQSVESMGPLGALYFGVAYTIAEVLAIPAIPLTASAGYLFGPVEGTAVVLISASIAAAISFIIGRTLLRDYVEDVLVDYPKFAKIDRAIGKEGFKLMLLLRLSPIFPFALSNYLYGASSINFPAFFWGTLLGFAPGTIAYVCTGAFGKALSEGGDSAYPWYVYAGGLAALTAFLKVAADTATKIVEELEDEEEII